MTDLRRQLEAMLYVTDKALRVDGWESTAWKEEASESNKQFAKDIRAGYDWLRDNLDHIIADAEKKDAATS